MRKIQLLNKTLIGLYLIEFIIMYILSAMLEAAS